MKDIKFLLKKKKKSDNMVVENTKMCQQMKNKTLLGIEKNAIKPPHLVIRNYCSKN